MSNAATYPAAGAPPIRIAMLGMIPGNGHPYSWSAIVNGYDPIAMADCPYPVIPRYLGAQPPGSIGIPGARVTHLWTDVPEEAPAVARASLIPCVVSRPETVIGLLHRTGAQLTLPVIHDGSGFGTIHVCGTKSHATFGFGDTYTDFRRQLVSFIEFVRSGQPPFPFSETVELMQLLIAGLRSRVENSRRVELAEIASLCA